MSEAAMPGMPADALARLLARFRSFVGQQATEAELARFRESDMADTDEYEVPQP